MFHLILDVKILDVKQLIGGGGGERLELYVCN